MFQVIVTILLTPFIPIFLYGHFDYLNDLSNKQPENLAGIVKGERGEKCEATESMAKYNFFPVEKFPSYELAPRRNEDSYDIKIWAGSSVAIDVPSGIILHYDNGRKKTQIASLTKIMTAILVMENIDNLNEEVTITKNILSIPGTVVGCPRSGYCLSNRLYVGEKVRALDLLKAMLMNSANDAATELAIHISGNEKDFVDTMNEKAKSLGLKDTHFCTPSGLEIDGKESECYSSAYDIARIAAYSFKYDKIWEIMRIPEDRFFSTDGKYMHELKNTDLLLAEMPDCLGGKTGFTPMAGKSLLTGVEDSNGKSRIIAVLLDDINRWKDMKILVNWIFNNYTWQ